MTPGIRTWWARDAMRSITTPGHRRCGWIVRTDTPVPSLERSGQHGRRRIGRNLAGGVSVADTEAASRRIWAAMPARSLASCPSRRTLRSPHRRA